MAAEGNIRFAVFARLSDGLALATFKGRGATASAVETTNKVLKSGNLKPKAQLTVTIDQTIGTLHLAAGDVDVIAVITSPDYPRRSAFQLLEEIRAKVDGSITPEEVTRATKAGEHAKHAFLREACLRFEDVAEVDKITAVGAQVDEVKAVMEGNINKMLDNAETVNAVEDKSELLRAGAQQFQKRSDHVRRMMWWRLFKIKLIFGTLVLVVLGYILIPIIIEQTAKDDDA
uniref:V-SNARE coiled-coil homology domain-containing protein n=1 Tax=Mantoniella antarctica TaxID=81844 RepID=A0A7S0X8N0_9CHLO|mmetsp:Transcript_29749/g.47839  ORF Transcript_29749/g.47839 Transcript_29749/m.47839 type:complete len:231 (+) Transcript_29749:300-992(+)